VNGRLNETNHSYINIPNVNLAPQGYLIVPEMLQAVNAKYIELVKGTFPQHAVKGVEHTVITTKDLARGDFLAGGVEKSNVTMTIPGPSVFFDPRIVDSYADPESTDTLNLWGYRRHNIQPIGKDNVGWEFLHHDLNFAFEWTVDNLDPNPDNQGFPDRTDDECAVTFLLYPNPYYSQRF